MMGLETYFLINFLLLRFLYDTCIILQLFIFSWNKPQWALCKLNSQLEVKVVWIMECSSYSKLVLFFNISNKSKVTNQKELQKLLFLFFFSLGKICDYMWFLPCRSSLYTTWFMLFKTLFISLLNRKKTRYFSRTSKFILAFDNSGLMKF